MTTDMDTGLERSRAFEGRARATRTPPVPPKGFGGAGGDVMTLPPPNGTVEPAPPRTPAGDADLPARAELILSAIEAGQFAGPNRRGAHRRRYRVRADLRLYSDPAAAPAWAVFTRDIHARGLGFVTPHRLPLGHGGVVELPAGDGRVVAVPCTLLRCREAAPGWFEGSLYFNRDQPQFAE